MTRWWLKHNWPFLAFIAAGVIFFGGFAYTEANVYNPNSYFCRYKIYQQTDGTCDVWYEGARFRSKCASLPNYVEAKAEQVRICKEMREFCRRRPGGKRVK